MTPTAVEIIASGMDRPELLRQTVAEGQVLRIGRAPQSGWAIPWDKLVSREHADVRWDGKVLRITCLDEAHNPVWHGDTSSREMSVGIGQEFRIGKTVFRVSHAAGSSPRADEALRTELESDTDRDVLEQSFSSEELRRVAFSDPERQMELLTGLPGMISASQSDEELATLLTGLLVEAIPNSDCVAAAQFDPEGLQEGEAAPEQLPEPVTMQVKAREGFQGRFQPSRRLIMKSLREQKSVIHTWRGGAGSEDFTVTRGLDWAFTTPIRGESCRGWCLYVSGQDPRAGADPKALEGDMRFTELVAQFISSIRHVRVLQEHKTQLSTFFSPNVIENLTSPKGSTALKPAERDVSILFCDVRGFSRKAEGMSQELDRLLESASSALGVMSEAILDRDGTIADFQGDAALGFWGWPVALEEGPIPACRAALEIARSFQEGERDETSLLRGFSVGIGIAHGRAIAGSIGTVKQAKVGVFGPIVNQCSRLEGLTKHFDTEICVDEATAEWIERLLPRSEGRLRRLARVRPKGMDSALTVFELRAPLEEDEGISDQMITEFETALDAVIEGRWDAALTRLDELPESDGPTKFLRRGMAAFENSPPKGWDGVFSLSSK